MCRIFATYLECKNKHFSRQSFVKKYCENYLWVRQLRTNNSPHFSLYFYTSVLVYSPFLFRKVRELLSYNLMYEQWLESTHRMFVLSSKAAVFYEIKKVEYRSTEVQKYTEKYENDFTYRLGGIVCLFLTILINFCTKPFISLSIAPLEPALNV